MSLICIKETGLIKDDTGKNMWSDSLACVYYDGMIHTVGVAENAVVPSKLHYVWDLQGNTMHRIVGPFAPRGEACVSLLGGKITAIGGTTVFDIWQFDPTIAGYTAGSWYQINASFEAAIGKRIMAAGVDIGGWFHIIGGWNTTTWYKTQDFINWTLVATLPSSMTSVSASASCVFNGKIYIIGGGTNIAPPYLGVQHYQSKVDGRVFECDPVAGTITEIYRNQEHFGSMWIDAVATDDYIYVLKGFVDAMQLSQFPSGSPVHQGNNRGLFRSADGVIWESLAMTDGVATLFERHRAGVVAVNNEAYILAGYYANDMWKITNS